MSLAGKSFSVLQRDMLLLVTGMVTNVLVARHMGPHVLGLWVILNLIPSYAETLGRVKVDVAAIYFLGRGKYHVGDVVYLLNVIALLTGCAIALPIVLFMDSFSATLFGADANEVRPFIYVMLMQIPLNFLYLNYVYLHIQREDVRSLNFMVLTRVLLASALILPSLYLFDLGLAAVVVSQAFAVAFAVILGVFRFGKTKRQRRRFDPPLIKDLLQYGGKLYIGSVITYLNSYTGQAMVVAFCVPAQVAYFTIAQQLGQLVSKVTEALGTFLFGRIAKSTNNAESADLAARAFRVSLTMLLPPVAVATLLLKPALLFLYGPSYGPVFLPFLIIVPGLTIAAATSTLSSYFQGIGRVDLVAKIAIAPVLLQVTLGYLLMARFEMVGAAFAFLAALLVTAIIQAAVFLRLSGTTVRSHLMIRREDITTVIGFIRGLLGRVGSRGRA